MPTELDKLFDQRKRLVDELATVQLELDGLNARIIEYLPPGGYEYEGHFWQSKASAKTTWDHTRVLSTLTVRALAMRTVSDDGEIEDPGIAVANAIADCAGISYWRKTRLRSYDMAPDQYCDSEYGRKRLVPQPIDGRGHDESAWTSSLSSANSKSEPPTAPSNDSTPTGPSENSSTK